MIDRYRHLNDSDPVEFPVNIEDLAKKVDAMNYGTHRMLCALARARLQRYPGDELGTALSRLLNDAELY